LQYVYRIFPKDSSACQYCKVSLWGMPLPEGLAAAAVRVGRPLVACIYDRVSRDPTRRHRSVERQEDANRAVCVDEGWVLPADAVYTDNDRSASRFATKPRPDWDRLRAAVAAGRYHVVILWEVSRGDRDDLGWLGFLHMCRNLGVWIYITSHERLYDPRKRRDYKTLAEEGLDSADESEKTSLRIRSDVQRHALKGEPHGVVPFGYRREYEVDTHGKRRIVAQLPDDTPRKATAADGSTVVYSPAALVREIVERLVRGETCLGLAAEFNWRGIPTPRAAEGGWDDSTVRRIAEKATYAGKRTHNGEVVADAVWPALISLSDHYTLVARFSDPERRTQRDSSIKYLGSGLFVCGVCHALVRTVKKPYGRAYVCTPKKKVKQPESDKPRKVSAEELEELDSLERREQTRRILELFEAGVTQTSIAKGLGINRQTLSLRVVTERRRRDGVPPSGAVAPPAARPAKRGYHVTRPIADVDTYVERAVWLRLLRPDIAELLAEDDAADERFAALSDEIAEKQARLDEARDSYASPNGLSMQALLRIEARLEPEIEQARARLSEARVGPVVRGLLHPTLDAVRAAWEGMPLPRRREVIRTLIDRVEILPIGGGRRVVPIENQVRIVWRQPNKTVEGLSAVPADPA
jgi:DNA invertase Pin-like site-specific DNA recombinase